MLIISMVLTMLIRTRRGASGRRVYLLKPNLPPSLACLLLFTSALCAQTSTSTTGWYQYFGDHPITDHWGIHAEIQWRRDSVITDWEQLLLRTGANYQVNKHLTLTLGYTYLRTFLYGEIP